MTHNVSQNTAVPDKQNPYGPDDWAREVQCLFQQLMRGACPDVVGVGVLRVMCRLPYFVLIISKTIFAPERTEKR